MYYSGCYDVLLELLRLILLCCMFVACITMPHIAQGLSPHALAPQTKTCVPVARLDAPFQAVDENVGAGDQTVEYLLGRHLLVEPDKQRTPPVSTPAGLGD
jgi:hypothetical protein